MSLPWENLITITLPILAGFGTIAFQNRAGRKKTAVDNYQKAYTELMLSIGEIATALMGHGDKGQADKRYALAKMAFSLVASEESLKALAAFDSLATSIPITPPESDHSRALVRIIRSAREDLHMKTKNVSDAELMRSTPLSG